MHRFNPKYFHPDPSYGPAGAMNLREEPDEEEEEEDDRGTDDEDEDNDGDNGYSE